MFFFLFSPGSLLIICYMLSKFEAPSCYIFLKIIWFSFLQFKRGITPQREIIQIFKKTPVSYFLIMNPSMKFQNPILNLKRGITPQREIIQIKKYIGQLFFDEESIFESSKPYLQFVTYGSTDGQAQSNMPLQLFNYSIDQIVYYSFTSFFSCKWKHMTSSISLIHYHS